MPPGPCSRISVDLKTRRNSNFWAMSSEPRVRPGYPLYVMLSHVFVQLPVGSIAYRANHFSAFMAAIACAMAYVVARQLGARRWYSACAAIGRRFARGVYFSGRNAGAAAPVDARRSERVLDRTIG